MQGRGIEGVCSGAVIVRLYACKDGSSQMDKKDAWLSVGNGEREQRGEHGSCESWRVMQSGREVVIDSWEGRNERKQRWWTQSLLMQGAGDVGVVRVSVVEARAG